MSLESCSVNKTERYETLQSQLSVTKYLIDLNRNIALIYIFSVVSLLEFIFKDKCGMCCKKE